jgi:hypothetical protein
MSAALQNTTDAGGSPPPSFVSLRMEFRELCVKSIVSREKNRLAPHAFDTLRSTARRVEHREIAPKSYEQPTPTRVMVMA